MAGTKEGARKARDINLAKDPDYYKRIGKLGGSADYNGKKGFAAMDKKKLTEASVKGGKASGPPR